MSLSSTLPFFLHILVETPAALNFFVNPLQQLAITSPAPQAEAVIRQYAVLLFSSNIVALIFAFRPVDTVSKRVAGALALYHLAPLGRALGRIWAGKAALTSGLGGPWVHAVVHGYTLLCLALLFFDEDEATEFPDHQD